jgi:hypothetical protein
VASSAIPSVRRPVSATALEHALIPEVAQSPQRREVDALWIEVSADSSRHRRFAGLYALSVVPRAPNFCALRRVSSNFERA